MSNVRVGVLKGGSGCFENQNGVGLDYQAAHKFVGYAHELNQAGLVRATALVASGAKVGGVKYCLERGIDPDTKTTVELCRRGIAHQYQLFEAAADEYGLESSMHIFTNREIDDEQAEGNFIKSELLKELSHGTVTVSNENPATSSDESKQLDMAEAEKRAGQDDAQPDNDWFAAHQAIALEAKFLVVQGDVDGFKIGGKRIREQVEVAEIEQLLQTHAQAKSKRGTGGIDSKMWALARAVTSGKVDEVIFGNFNKSPLDMLLGKVICTRVVQ